MVERDELELLVLGFGLIERFFQVCGRALIVLQALSCIQEPFLFVKRHAVIQPHNAARRSELAYRSRR